MSQGSEAQRNNPFAAITLRVNDASCGIPQIFQKTPVNAGVFCF
jgi:hypothetical protein